MSEKVKASVNMDDMTFGELELFEEVTGLVMSDAVRQEIVRDSTGRPVPDPDDPKGRPLKEVKMSAKAMMGMVFIALHKQNPDLTFNDVRAMKLSDIDFEMEEPVSTDPHVDPTQPVEEQDESTMREESVSD